MKRLIFEIISHGVSDPQHFLGCGVVGTEFTHKATGSGSSEREAGRDAGEIMFQAATDFAEVHIGDLDRLEAEIEGLSEAEDAHDNCGCMDKTMETADEFCDAAYYVSIRWRVG